MMRSDRDRTKNSVEIDLPAVVAIKAPCTVPPAWCSWCQTFFMMPAAAITITVMVAVMVARECGHGRNHW